MGIEPTLSAWKAEVLPLNYTRKRVSILLELESASLLRLTSRRPHVLRVHSGCSHQPRLAANPITGSILY